MLGNSVEALIFKIDHDAMHPSATTIEGTEFNQVSTVSIINIVLDCKTRYA